jgi:hypothetical protein
MNRRGTSLKLLLLALPLAAGIASLHAFGEPGGRAVRATLMAWEYPERVHGRFHVRDRRGSEYHLSVAQTLEEFTQEISRAWADPALLHLPQRVTVLLVDSIEDVESFGFETRRIDQGGLVDAGTATLVLVGQGPARNLAQDSRALRHLMTHLLFPGASAPWLMEGLACHFESLSKGASEAGSRHARGDPPSLGWLLRAPEADFRGPPGAALLEGAHLLVAFLLEKERGTLSELLRGGRAPLLDDLPALEARWHAWLSRTK